MLVCDVERGSDLSQDPQRLSRCKRVVLAEQRAEITAFHAAHGDVKQPVGLSGVVDGHDVRVGNRGRRPRLAYEAVAEGLVLGELRCQQFEGDSAAKVKVLRPVDDAHAAAADHLLYAIAGEPSANPGLGWHPRRLYTPATCGTRAVE